MAFWSNLFKSRRVSTNGNPPLSVQQRVSALKHLPPFLKLVWQTNPRMAFLNVVLRLLKAAVPLAMLYVGQLIIDEVIRLTQITGEPELRYLLTLVAIEF